MVTLRHLGRPPFFADGKEGGAWFAPDAPGGRMADLSGSPLVQNLSRIPLPDGNPFALVTPSGGVETALRVELEEEVLRRSRLEGGGCLWSSSGSDAMEMAVWAADLYARKTRGGPIRTFLVRRGGYHGNTYLTRFLSTRGGAERPTSMDGRSLVILEDWAAPGEPDALLDQLKQAERDGRINHPAAVVCEPLPTTGETFWPGMDSYRRLARWCRERDILVVFDEVASGAYRHGLFNAFEWAGGADEAPDISAVSKGLTCGTFPLSCVVFSARLSSFLESQGRPLSFTHGLSEPGAWFALATLRCYDEVFASQAYAARREVIQNLAREAATRLQSARVERSETTIRLAMSASQSKAVLEAMMKEGLWAYGGYTDFPAPEGARRRAFIHLCPPFDIPPEQTEELLSRAVGLAVDTLSGGGKSHG